MSNVVADAMREIDAARAIRASLVNLTDDEDALRDTLDGATSLDRVVSALILSIKADEAMAKGLGDCIDDLKARKDRFAARVEAKRTLIEQAMALVGWTKHECDAGTVSLRKPAPALVVTDESRIPAAYWKNDPKLDRRAVLDALKADVVVPGAELKNGAHVLQIR